VAAEGLIHISDGDGSCLRRSNKKQSVSLHLCRLRFNLLNCSKHYAIALMHARHTSKAAQNADVPPVTQRGSLNRAMEHGDLLTCVNRHFFGLYGHSATIF
jgi:hypothetical protein